MVNNVIISQRHAALMALKRISSFRQFLRMEECPLAISEATTDVRLLVTDEHRTSCCHVTSLRKHPSTPLISASSQFGQVNGPLFKHTKDGTVRHISRQCVLGDKEIPRHYAGALKNQRNDEFGARRISRVRKGRT